MRIYRCITADEITNLYKGLEQHQPMVYGENTHSYQKDTSYIHFFRYSQSAQYFFEKNRYYVYNRTRPIAYMVANVPNSILKKYAGYGYYTYENELFNNELIPLPEYAIKKEDFQDEYIVEINSFINGEYTSNDSEYQEYLKLVRKLLTKLDNHYQVAKYLKENDLSHLLRIKEDDRTEKEIREEKAKELCKALSELL